MILRCDRRFACFKCLFIKKIVANLMNICCIFFNTLFLKKYVLPKRIWYDLEKLCDNWINLHAICTDEYFAKSHDFFNVCMRYIFAVTAK